MRRAAENGTIMTPMTHVESTQFAAEQIRNAIINGHYKPGDRLVEQQLTDILNVSRHPVREALRLLAREGFVDIQRNKGASVTALDSDSVIDVYNLRMAMGKMALEHLLLEPGKISPAMLKKLKKLSESAIKYSTLEDQSQTIKNDLEFQQTIIDATGLQRTMRYFSELSGDVRRFNNLLSVVYTDRAGDAKKYVVKLFEAIRDGNLEAAQSIWQAKFRKAVDRYLTLIKRGESDGARRPR